MPGDRGPRMRQANVAGGRPVAHRVCVSVEEEAVLARRAAAERVTVARLLVESALSGGGETPSERRVLVEELFAARRELARVGVNVNQLARKANVGEGFPVEEARAFLVESRALAARIDAAIDAVASLGVAAA